MEKMIVGVHFGSQSHTFTLGTLLLTDSYAPVVLLFEMKIPQTTDERSIKNKFEFKTVNFEKTRKL